MQRNRTQLPAAPHISKKSKKVPLSRLAAATGESRLGLYNGGFFGTIYAAVR
jgi:hypothetical protein